MTTEYTTRATLACPESLIAAANQLALIAGESAADINTFRTAGYEDTLGNLYAVCSTVVKPVFYSVQGGLPSELPSHAEDADTELAQQALDALVAWQDGDTLQSDKLTMIVGGTAQEAIASLGLSQIETEEEI